jgi:hypothetical protein
LKYFTIKDKIKIRENDLQCSRDKNILEY